jgi:hypothetical protein
MVVSGCTVWSVVSDIEHPAIRMDATRRRITPGTKTEVLCIVIIASGSF